jgi:hypothetical protein
VLLEDGRTILAVYPKGHGRGAIVMKRSTDGGPRETGSDGWEATRISCTAGRASTGCA